MMEICRNTIWSWKWNNFVQKYQLMNNAGGFFVVVILLLLFSPPSLILNTRGMCTITFLDLVGIHKQFYTPYNFKLLSFLIEVLLLYTALY